MPRVFVPENLRRYCDDAECLSIPGASVAELLDALGKRHPELAERVVDSDARLRRHIAMIRNDEILAREGLEHQAIREEDELRIFLAASGG